MLSLSSYSQQDTNKQDTNLVVKVDTSVVILPTRVARLAFQDLIRYDGLKLEVTKLYNLITFKDDEIGLFKQKDTLKDQKIGNLELIISKKDEQFSLEREKSNSLLKELKGQRTKTFFYKVGTFAGIIATSFLLLK